MIRGKDESEDFDLIQPGRACQYAAHDFVGPLRRTQQKSSLETTGSHELDLTGLEHPQRPSHPTPPVDGILSSTSRANEVFDTPMS